MPWLKEIPQRLQLFLYPQLSNCRREPSVVSHTIQYHVQSQLPPESQLEHSLKAILSWNEAPSTSACTQAIALLFLKQQRLIVIWWYLSAKHWHLAHL